MPEKWNLITEFFQVLKHATIKGLKVDKSRQHSGSSSLPTYKIQSDKRLLKLNIHIYRRQLLTRYFRRVLHEQNF